MKKEQKEEVREREGRGYRKGRRKKGRREEKKDGKRRPKPGLTGIHVLMGSTVIDYRRDLLQGFIK